MSGVPVIEGELIDDPVSVPGAFTGSAPGAVTPYVPRPNSSLAPNRPSPVSSYPESANASTRYDTSQPNYMGTDPRDWDDDVARWNQEANDYFRDEDLAAEATERLNNRRNRRGFNRPNYRGLARDVAEDGAIGALGWLSDELGIPTDPSDFATLGTDTGTSLARSLFGGGEADYTPQDGFGPAPFTGGQSPGVLYDISLSTFSFNSEGQKISNNHNTQLRGPINVFRLNTGSGSVLNTVRVQGSNGFKDYKRANSIELFFENVSTPRADGQPDTGGDPQGEPQPVGRPNNGTEPDFSDPAAPTVPGVGLPDPSVPGFPSIGNPFGSQPEPEGEPSGGFPGIDPILPTVPSFPGFDPTGQPGADPTGGSGGGSGGDPGEGLSCCEKIDQIHSYFQVSGLGVYDAGQCDAGPLPDAWTGTGLSGLYRAVEALTRAVGLIWERLRCLEGGAIAIPEWWAVRPGADVPQLAVAFETEDSRSRWSITIPHYIKGQDHRPQIPKFKKGTYFSTLTLTDNTKLVINAKDFNEGERVILALVPLIDPAYLPANLDIHQGRRKGKVLTEVEVTPQTAAFYSQGQQSPLPDFYADIQVI